MKLQDIKVIDVLYWVNIISLFSINGILWGASNLIHIPILALISLVIFANIMFVKEYKK